MNIGQYNDLRINRMVDFGAYLIDDDTHEVLLPKRYLTSQMHVGDTLRVFVYHDSEGRPVATTEQPVATVGQFALMRVKSAGPVGIFLDWGLSAKDLLVPFNQQRVDMKPGRSYVVRVYLDKVSGRVAASAKLGRFLNTTPPDYYHRQRVDLLVVQRSELGYRVIVEGKHWGQIYQNEIYQEVNVGDRLTGFVKQVRPDGKVDVTLAKIEKLRVDDLADTILAYLQSHDGTMPITDSATPEQILATFNCSKRDFKKALGLLYKRQQVSLNPTSVTLTSNK